MAETTIPTAALVRVLEGARVATKAPTAYVQPVSDWLQRYGAVGGSDSPLGVSADDKGSSNRTLTFDEWCGIVKSQPELNTAGVKQLSQIVLAVGLLRERSRRHLPMDAAVLDIIWNLVFEAIITAEQTELQFTVSRSAQGFLAVPLCSLLHNGKIDELWRFHTWMPDEQRGIDEKVCIHAHQPYGQSWTLLGCGTDYAFHVDAPEDEDLTTHAIYQCCYVSDSGKAGSGYQTHQMSSTIRSSGKLLRVQDGAVFPHTRDSTYSVPGGAYHRSVVPGKRLHATLFVFDASRGYDDDAGVLGPKDGGEYVQLRDPAGITPVALAQMANAARKWEQRHEIARHANDEHPTVMAYYRMFRGLGLLKAGQKDDALQHLNALDELTPLQAFAQDPSAEHHQYIKELLKAGANLSLKDATGRTALEYARESGDATTISLLTSQ